MTTTSFGKLIVPRNSNDERKSEMKRTVLVFGLIAGAIMAAMMFITMPLIDRIRPERAEIIGYTTMVIAFLMIFFGIRSYRENVGGGSISFGRALSVGLLIVLVASICYV